MIGSIKKSRYEMLKKVSNETVQLYWHIGKIVFQKNQQSGWGKSVVEQLSKDLQIEFPGIRGFSARNIWRMKVFYGTYSHLEFLPPAVAEIGWSQNYLIIEKCKNEKERLFYLNQTKNYGWSKSDLAEKIKTHFFQNKLLVQNNFPTTISDKLTVENLAGMVVHSSDGSVLFSNPKAYHILGITQEQMQEKELIDPSWSFVNEDLSIMKVEDYPVSRVIATKQRLDSYQVGIKTKERDYITWAFVNAKPVFSDNELDKIIVNFVDITERLSAEQAGKRAMEIPNSEIHKGEILCLLI